MSVAALDAEHDACAGALKQLAAKRSLAALDQVLTAYEKHFAHEEELLDLHYWPEAAAAANGGAASGFDARASMRRTHLADHARMIKELAPGYAALARDKGDSGVSRDAPLVPPAVVERALRDFEAHANTYDSYGDELAAALAQSDASPAAVIAVA